MARCRLTALLTMLTCILGCGSGNGGDEFRQEIRAPSLSSGNDGIFFVTIAVDGLGTGSLYYYDFAEGKITSYFAADVQDPLLASIGSRLVMIERKSGAHTISEAEISSILERPGQENSTYRPVPKPISGMEGGDPWDVLPFDDDGVLFLNPLAGAIEYRAWNGQILGTLDRQDLGTTHFRPVKGIARQGSRYSVASQGLSNSENPVMNGKQAIIDFALDADGDITGSPTVSPFSIPAVQSFQAHGSGFQAFGLCVDNERSCAPGMASLERGAGGKFEETAFTGFERDFVQFGGAAAAEDFFLAQVSGTDGQQIQLMGWKDGGGAGEGLYDFAGDNITNIHLEEDSRLAFFGDAFGDQGVLVIFDADSGEQLDQIEVSGLPYSFAVNE